MFSTTRSLFTTPTKPGPYCIPPRFHHRRTTQIKMSTTTTTTTTIEHIVLFKVKPNTPQSSLTTMLTGLNSLTFLPNVLHLTAGPIHRTTTNSPFTHLLHSRYPTQQDLAHYSAHQAHLDVVRSSVLPICDDIMALDWAAHNLLGPIALPPRSALRIQFLKLKEGVGDQAKDEVLEVISGLNANISGLDQLSFGVNFSPARAKGFSIASIGVFPGIDELDCVVEEGRLELEKDKVRGFVDDVIVLDYVVPSTQSTASL